MATTITTRLRWRLSGAVLSLAAALLAHAADAVTISFHDAPPTPDADDQFNFVGGSRDGLNVNDENGLDGPLNDNFTYVANDRPRQGQMFRTPPAATALRPQAIWLRLVGYTNNGTMPESGFNGTDTDFSPGGLFMVRILDLDLINGIPVPITGVIFGQDVVLTGTEPSNPNSVGRSTTTNGLGAWMRIGLDGLFPGTSGLKPDHPYAFDLASTSAQNRLFEWLGTKDDVYAGGSAYNGTQLGLGSSTGELNVNSRIGDRVFMVQMTLVPEPHGLTLAAIAMLALRRRSR